MDGARPQGWRISIGTFSPAVIVSSFFSGAVLLIVCTRSASVCCLVMTGVGRECSTVLTARLLTCCILIRWPASIRTIARSCAWQDDSAVFIHQWIDQHPLEEHLVEQLLQVGRGCRVEAVAVFEEVKSLGEVLADFSGIGLVGGQLALNLAQLGGELGLFLFEELKGDGSFVVGVEQAAASVFDWTAGYFSDSDCLCFRLPLLSPGNRVRPRSGCGILGLSEGEHDCISARSTRQYP